MQQDDLAEQSPAIQSYTVARGPANSDDSEIRKLEMQAGIGAPTPEPSSANAAFAAQAQGADHIISTFQKSLKEIVPQAAGGALASIQELGNTVHDLADWGENFAAKMGVGTGDLISSDPHYFTFADKAIPKAETLAGSMTRSAAQFLFPYLTGTKLLGTGGKLANLLRSGVVGAAVDFSAFDPHEERLSNFVQKTGLANPVAAYLAADPKDKGAEARFKQMLEGAGLGALTEGVFLAVKGIKGVRAAKAAVEPGAQVAEQAAASAAPKAEQSVASAEIGAVPAQVDQVKAPATQANPPGAPPIPAEAKVAKPALDLTPLAPEGGNFLEPVVKGESNAPTTGQAFNINLNKLESPDQIKQAISIMAEKDRATMDTARRGVVTDEEVAKLADALNMTPEQLKQRGIGQAFNAEQLRASRQLLVLSGDNLLEKAKLAYGPEATDASRVAFMEAINAHRAIQAHVSGATAEAGRALRSMRSVVGMPDDAMKARAIKDIIQLSGGADNIDVMAKQLSEIAAGKTDIELSKTLGKWQQRSTVQKAGDALMEMYVNGLLSRPSTHAVNFISNAIGVVTPIIERGMARGISVLKRSEDGVAAGEASSMISGALGGMADAAKLAYYSITKNKEAADKLAGNQFFDAVNKSELPMLPAISGERFGLQDTPVLGKALDLMGHAVRLPSLALNGSDKLFKMINYRSELNALAVRDGVQRGLEGDALKAHIQGVLENPPPELMDQAVSAARYNTFNQPLEGNLERIDQVIKNVPGLRIIFPFVRTPSNIFLYAAERNPLTAMAFGKFREDLVAGGVKGDIAQARLAFGSTVIGLTAALAANGLITGSGPVNPESRKILENSGWQPDSVKIGDKWYSFKRIDPMGNLLGMAGDYAALAGHLDDTELERLVAVGAALTARQLTPEFMAQHLPPLLDAIQDPEKEGPHFISQLASGFVPGFVRDIKRAQDPIVRDTGEDANAPGPIWQRITNSLKANIPGMSESLPPRLNVFGEPVVAPNGVGPDWLSPIATNKATEEPILKELVRLKMADSVLKPQLKPGEQDFRISLPPDVIEKGGLRVNLTPQEHAQLIKLSAGIGLRGADQTLKDALNSVVKKGSNYYQKNDEMKKLAITQIISKYRSAAKSQLINDHPEIFKRLTNQAEMRSQRLMGDQ